MTYNIKVLPPGDEAYEEWINIRRWNIQQAVVENDVDVVGFQEARSEMGGFTPSNQQAELADTFVGTPWDFHRWDDPTVEPYASSGAESLAVHNKNPIALHRRCAVVATGTELIQWTDILSPTEWDDFYALHIYFHGQDRNGSDGINDWAHHFDPVRHATWIIYTAENNCTKILLINTHYETYPEDNECENTGEVAWQRFLEYIERCFIYTSEQLVHHANAIAARFAVDKIILLGDYEVGEEDAVVLAPFINAGFTETWWDVQHTGGPLETTRPTSGVDHIYVKGLNIVDSFYDQNRNYTGRAIASDHKPLLVVYSLAPASPGDADVLNCQRRAAAEGRV